MWVAPIRSGLGDQKIDDFEREMNEWHNFVDETEAHYGVNMNALTKAYRAEHEKYYLKVNIRPLSTICKNVYFPVALYCFMLYTEQ